MDKDAYTYGDTVDNNSIKSRLLMEYVFLRYYRKVLPGLPRVIMMPVINRLIEKLPEKLSGQVKNLKNASKGKKEIDEWKIKYIQLEITYRCNLLCVKCNRHCNLDLPYLKGAEMTMEQLKKFIREVKQKDIHLERIRILGGEPLLHPEIENFVSILFYELIVPGNLERIVIITNGVIYRRGKLNDYIKNIMLDPYIKRAFKVKMIKFRISHIKKEEEFFWVLASPEDLGFKWHQCDQPNVCGTLLNTYGYWPQGVCGAIARLFCLNEYVRDEFPIYFNETWPNLEENVCRYCVFASEELQNELNNNKDLESMSASYKEAFERWQNGGGCTFQKY